MLEKKSIDNMLNFLLIYQERSGKIADQLFELKDRVEQIEKELNVLRTNLANLSPEETVKYERYEISEVWMIRV